MDYLIEHIAKALKEARGNKGLSQRALSKKSGVPQGHISKIENGAVDLRLSSLIQLARVLDLELALVPRKIVPAVQSIIRTAAPSTPHNNTTATQALRELSRAQDALAKLSKSFQDTNQFAQLRHQLKDLQRFQLDGGAMKSIREANNKILKTLKESTKATDAIGDLNSNFAHIRNALVRASINPQQVKGPRPAYSLDEEEDDA